MKAWTKDGRVLTFGGTDNAKMAAYTLIGTQPEDPHFVRTGPNRITAAWGLSRIQDRDGNAIDIIYENGDLEPDDWGARLRLRKIQYGPGRQIDFLHEHG